MEIKIMPRTLLAFSIFILITVVNAQGRYDSVVKNENEVEVQEKPLKIKSQNNIDFFNNKLVENPTCSEDIKRLCGKDIHNFNNFAVLECIQNEERDDSALISDDCHHVLWTYKYELTHSSQVENLARGYCKDEIDLFNECSSGEGGYGNTISCLIQNINKVQQDKCRQYVVRLGAIIFSDYHLVQHMTESCKTDIEKQSCGRVQTGSNKEPHSQGLTIECLSKHADELENECKTQIFKLAELQSEDFHLDRAFYFACREDRDKFCKDVRAGQGKVYKCLFQHRKERTMSQDCAEQLTNRRNLIVRDYKVSKSLVKACREAIKENQCRKSINKDEEAVVKLPKILRCLESALRKGKIADGECKEEIIAHRQTVFEMSPSVIENCKPELLEFCSEARGPNKLHCLLKHYSKKNKEKISPQCTAAIEEVLKVSDPAEDWRVDPILHDACLPVVQTRCRGFKGGEGRIMRCLMRNLNSPQMTLDCEAALLEIQYFVARDWKLDPQLYRNCHSDAEKFCHAAHDWTDTTSVQGPDNSILVLPCLFRYAYHPSPNLRLTKGCAQDVRRVMIERAAFVQLHPRIEMECLEPLVKYCSENTGPGEEMLCLQENMEKLTGECLTLIKNYTEAEVKDVGLNSLITTHCTEVINSLCSDALQNRQIDEGSVMDCLIRNKNGQEMRRPIYSKCRAVVENFQIIMMKDIAFTPKFKRECHQSVKQYCADLTSRKEILDCLADRILRDVLNDDHSSIGKACRQQVRKQLTQRHENINFDSELRKKCENNINELCEEENEPGMILECLRKNRNMLEEECHRVVFRREEIESVYPSTDVVLMQSCRQMVKLFCPNEESSHIFSCLKNQIDNSDFDLKCRDVIMQRMIERSQDISLNPDLFKACIQDAQLYCPNELSHKNGVERNGRVIECLKERLPEGKLTSSCRLKIIQITKNSALNYRLDPILVDKCKDDMQTLCNTILMRDSEKGEMEECLKQQQTKIVSEQCKIHVAQIMHMEQADIHADPLLYLSCKIDDKKFCGDLIIGEHLRCLFDVLDKNPNGLEDECRSKLKERRDMYKAAVKLTKLETVDDIVEGVRSSPNRNLFLIILCTLVGVIFIVGLSCGRASRSYRLLKNR